MTSSTPAGPGPNDYVCELKTLVAQPALAVRFSCTQEEIAAHIGDVYGRVMAYAGAHGATIAGMPFLIAHATGQTFDLEAGFPVAAPVAGEGDIAAISLPAGDAVVTTHHGSYEDLGPAYAVVSAYAAAHGRQPRGPAWETYFTDPETQPDPAKWRTDVCLPVT
jgi:effector-binding domain-containing protein